MTDVSSQASVTNTTKTRPAFSESGPSSVQTGGGSLFSAQAPLVPTLLVLLAVELIAHRLALPALQPGLLEDESTAYMYLAAYSPFFYHAACLLAVAAMCWTLIEIMRDDRFAPLGWRVLLGLSFCVFMPMATVGSMVASSLEITPYASVRRLLPYLNISFILVILVMMAVSWTRSLRLRHRIALTFFAVPVIMLSVFQYRMFVWTFPHIQAHAYEQIGRFVYLLEYGSLAAALAGYWIIILLAPDPVDRSDSPDGVPEGVPDGVDSNPEPAPENSGDNGRIRAVFKQRFRAVAYSLTHPAALTIALAFTVLIGVLLKFFFTPGQKLVENAMGISLPAPSFRALVFMGSFFLIVVVIVNLYLAGREERLSAAGLLLMVLGGYRLNEPLAYLSIVLGFLCIHRGAAAVQDRDDPAPSKEHPLIMEKRWKQYIIALAEKLSRPKAGAHLDTAVLNTRNTQVSRIFGDWFGSLLDIRFLRKSRRLAAVEFTLGEVPSGNPDWSIQRKASFLSTPPGDAETLFNVHFQITDKKGLGERIMTPSDYKTCIDNIHGDVSVWWGIGLKHRIDVDALIDWADSVADAPLPVPINELASDSDATPSPGKVPAIVNLLTDWAERAGITNRDSNSEG